MSHVSEAAGKKRKDRGSLSEGEVAGLNVSYTSLVWDDEERRSVKKQKETEGTRAGKRLSISGKKKMKERVIALLKEVQKEMKVISKVVEDNKNTKVELKRGIEKLSSMVSQLTTNEVFEMLEGVEERRQIIMINDTEERGTQTEDTGVLDTEWAARIRETRNLRKREETFKEARSKGTVSNLLRDRWKKEWFVCTQIVEGSPLAATEGDTALITVVPHEKDMDKGIMKFYKERCPVLQRLDARDRIQSVRITNTTQIEGEDLEQESRSIIYKGSVEDTDDLQILNILDKLRESAVRQHSTTLVCPTIHGVHGERMRKLVEMAFVGKDIKVNIHVPMGARQEAASRTKERVTAKEESKQPRPRRPRAVGRNSLAMVVESKDKDHGYKDTLRQVKLAIGCTESRKAVKTLRSTRDGKVLIIMDKNEDTYQKMQEALDHSGNLGTKRAGNDQTNDMLHIRGMDALTTKDDIVAALEEKLGSLRDRFFKIGELRPNIRDTLAATITLNREDADTIEEAQHLRVGMVRCKVEKRIKLLRCFKCWAYDHKASECTGTEDRSKDCYNCGKVGHGAKECKEVEWCPICNKEGHKADSGKCPAFRRALLAAKKGNLQPKSVSTEPSITSDVASSQGPEAAEAASVPVNSLC